MLQSIVIKETSKKKRQVLFASFAMECSLCLEKFQDPRNLPCGHTFCDQCLQKLVKSSGRKDFECSLCRKIWQIPQGGLNALPKNYVAEGFKNVLPSNTVCILANAGNLHEEAEYFCVDCWDAMCASCSKAHTQTKFTSNHTLKLMKEVTRNDVEQHRKQMATKCANHSNQDVVVYCNNCKEIACTICCVTKHSKHDCIELSKADSEFIKEINDVLIKGQNMKRDLQIEIAELNNAYKNLTKLRMIAINVVLSTTAELKQKFRAAYEEVLQRIDEVQSTTVNLIEKHLEDEFKDELKAFDHHEHALTLHNALCESLLSSSSTVVNRAERMNNVMSQVIMPRKSLLLQHKIEDQIKSLVATANYKFIFEPNTKHTFTMPSVNFYKSFKILSDRRSEVAHSKRDHSVTKFFEKEKTESSKLKSKNSGAMSQLLPAIKNNSKDDNILGVHFFENKMTCSFQGDVYIISIDNETSSREIKGYSAENAVLLIDNEIIISSLNELKTVSLMQTGVSSSCQISQVHGLYVVANDNVLLAANDGIYNTVNRGRSWYRVFAMPDKTVCYKVVQVKETLPITTKSTVYSLWIIEQILTSPGVFLKTEGRTEMCLSSYSSFTSSRNLMTGLKRIVADNSPKVSTLSHLAWDGNDVVMMSDYHNHEIHMYSVKSKLYLGKLPIQSPKHILHPTGLHFNVDYNLLFVGLADRKCVSVYTYEVSEKNKNNDIHCFEISVKI